jgi:hypothetical protein
LSSLILSFAEEKGRVASKGWCPSGGYKA